MSCLSLTHLGIAAPCRAPSTVYDLGWGAACCFADAGTPPNVPTPLGLLRSADVYFSFGHKRCW